MKKRTKPSVFAYLARRIVIPVITLWLLAMGLLTWAVARDFYLQLEDSTRGWAATKYTSNKNSTMVLTKMSYRPSYPGAEPLLPILINQTANGYGSDHWLWGKWELLFGYQAAIRLTDETKGFTLSSGDYLFFDYQDRFGYVDLDELEGGKEFADTYISSNPAGDLFFIFKSLRMTGYFEGERFYPARISIGHIHSSAYDTYEFPVPDSSRSLIPISISLDDTNDSVCGLNYDPGSPFQWNGKVYENAAELLDEEQLKTGFGLFGSVIRVFDRIDTTRVTAVVYCKPIVPALMQTWHLWLITGIAAAIYLYRCLRKLKFDLTNPLKAINWAYTDGDSNLKSFGRSTLKELDELGKHFDEAQQDRYAAKSQVQQLKTALDYAKEAEENRRSLVSAMAHELKTPLAVIHGYAEGLAEGIAEEKKEQYLSVLLEESEKMDAMVLEMLDYSRLEAGKVKLSRDRFSLTELTMQVFDRLSLAVQQRELTVTFEQAEEFFVNADEGRIRQVITNFATNAVKYTPQGGSIRVRIFKRNLHAWVQVENDSEPFTQETLEHVWDSFYRADTARSGGGTGLGLAIVKSIVGLHRGLCFVQNTDTGVLFGFRIPL